MAKTTRTTARRFYPRQLLNRLNGKLHDSLTSRDLHVLSFFMKKSRKYGLTILGAHRIVIGKEKIIHMMSDDKFYREAHEPFISSENLAKLNQLEKHLNCAQLHIGSRN